VTSAQRFRLAVAAGSGSLLTLLGLYFVGQVGSFENLTAPAWQLHYRVWGILALVIPGVLVGIVADHKRWVAGAIAGALACALAAIAIWVVLAIKQSLGVDSWLGVALVVTLHCVACGTFAWLTGVARDR
jgi:hypothetical protein